TERKRADEQRASLESQLRQAQKLEEIGTLASGIAHDFNNILAIILTYTELAKLEVDKPDEAGKHLAQGILAGNRRREMVGRILAFSLNRRNEPKPIQLRPIIEEGLKLLRAAIPPSVEIDATIDPDLPTTLADSTQMHQVLLNLCTNAAHAMRDRP